MSKDETTGICRSALMLMTSLENVCYNFEDVKIKFGGTGCRIYTGCVGRQCDTDILGHFSLFQSDWKDFRFSQYQGEERRD